MTRTVPSLAVAIASLLLLWAAPSVAEKIARPESLLTNPDVCGTGQKAARKAYAAGANISLTAALACAAAIIVERKRLPVWQRCLGGLAIIIGVTHGFLAYFGATVAYAF